MDVSLRDKLKRLGVQKGAANLKPVAEPARVIALDSHEPLWNVEERTPYGIARIRRAHYDLQHQHGDRSLARAIQQPIQNLDLRRAIFLDTETTGLSGGAGTLAFLVGVGYFVENGFVVDQYFLHDPAHEAAMLAHLDQRAAPFDNLVTFNGRAFDIPLLESRLTLARIAPSFADKQHLDLLIPARRMWRGSLASCSLGSLEFHLLDIKRDQQDIAGFLIPQLYREYLMRHARLAGAAGSDEDMRRVMYHNLYDILSMVTLASRLHEAYEQPRDEREHAAIGAIHERNGDFDRAAAAFERAVQMAPAAQEIEPRRRLARVLKKIDRREDAVTQWQLLAERDDLSALIELAKHYEWREINLSEAQEYASRAWSLARDPITRSEIEHRLQRLKKKIEKERQA